MVLRRASPSLHASTHSAQTRWTAALHLLLSLSLTMQAAATTKKPPLKPVNLNSASAQELQEVPGIGPSTADKILQMRKSYGAFKSVDDLMAIRGIGKKRLEKMRKYLTVGKSAVTNNSPHAAQCAGCVKTNPASTKTPALKSPAQTKPANPVPAPQSDSTDPEEPRLS